MDFLDILLFFYNISFDYAPYKARFSYIFWDLLEFYSLVANSPTNACQNYLISWTISDISSKVQLLPSCTGKSSMGCRLAPLIPPRVPDGTRGLTFLYSSKAALLAVSKISVTSFFGSAVSFDTITAAAMEQINPGTIS